jgi:hypothetical protein
MNFIHGAGFSDDSCWKRDISLTDKTSSIDSSNDNFININSIRE